MRHICLLLLSTALLCACEDSRVNVQSNVPQAPVSYTINIMQDAPELSVPGGVHTVTEPWRLYQYIGYSGLVVFHGFDDQFYAFDLCCPYECQRDIRVECNMAGTAVCPRCGSVYDIGFGSGMPSKGGSKYPMRRYSVYVSGYTLHVSQ